ncbi:MAG: class I SAM-dependent methyltransferase [Opitutaceae bacterium]
MKRRVTHAGLVLAESWTDFEVIETGDGMKKERWGDIVLVRPDPQVIWPRASASWGKCDGIYHRAGSGGGEWIFHRALPEAWTIRYHKLAFKIRPTSFKHTGLFPEQAANWEWFSSRIKNAGRPVRVLNLFGYTGGATVAAAAAGASVCHVDAAKGMVQWCRENIAASGLADAPVRTIVDDCLKFVEREFRRGNSYDAVIMDPPSFGRGKNGGVWKLEEGLFSLVAAAASLLSDHPLFMLVNAYTTGLSPIVLANILAQHAPAGGAVTCGEVGLPVSQGRVTLPCGTFARWES